MIVSSIDIMNGEAVQLRNGKELVLRAGDPSEALSRFDLFGEIAVIDLDAALGQGSNRVAIEDLLKTRACRVGGGIRDREAAYELLDAGASSIIIGTAATPEFLRALPRERVIAALDTAKGEVVVDGWRTGTGRGVIEQIKSLTPYVDGFLVTFVEREGCLEGLPIDQIEELVELSDRSLTVAGGCASVEEVAALDRIGVDVQVGMALYQNRFSLSDVIASMLVSDREDGLWPTVVVDESQRALGLAWSSQESLSEALQKRRGIYCSRRRGLWEKGKTSGNSQQLLRVDLDCDRDALRFTVSQQGKGFCHQPSWTCWGEENGLPALMRCLEARKSSMPTESFTAKLLEKPELLRAKLLEEAEEPRRGRKARRCGLGSS